MQIQLFAIDPASADRPAPVRTTRNVGSIRKANKPTKVQPERVVLGHYVFETWVSYPARTVNADDGLRVEFTVPVHLDLYDLVRSLSPDKTEILCKYRVRKGFSWGQLGRKAGVLVDADLCQGPKGGLYLHCLNVDITNGHPIRGEKLGKSLMKKLEKAAAAE